MKQKIFNLSMLLLFMIVGLGSAWAEEISIEINVDNSGVTGSYADKTFTVKGFDFGFTQWMKSNNIQAKKSTTNSLYNVSEIPGVIKRIVIEQTGTARGIKIFGGTKEKPTEEITAPETAKEMVFDFSDYEYTYFSMTTPGNACYFEKITIVYEGQEISDAPTLTKGAIFSTNYYNVTITNNEVGATVYYTTDGTNPTTSSSSFTGTSKIIAINETTTIKAMAVIEGKINSEVVSVTYTYEEPKYVNLPFSFDKGKSDLAKIDGVTQNGLGTDYSNSPYLRFDTTGDFVLIQFNESPTTLTYTIKGNGFGGGTFDVLESADGIIFTCVQQYDGQNLPSSSCVERKNLKSSTRYIKFVYTNKSSGNVALGAINISKSLTISINPACTDDKSVYSTFSSSRPFIVPDGLIVSEIAIVGDELLVVSYDTGDIVPANTGVMVSAEKGGEYDVEIADAEMAESAQQPLGEDNRLRPSGDAGITADKMAANDADCTYFRLTMHNGTQIGYWWGAEEGAAFGLAANKAYLAVPNSAEVKSNLWFSGNATSVSIPKVEAENATIYNLAGQRVSTAAKGLYIKNGKKYMVK